MIIGTIVSAILCFGTYLIGLQVGRSETFRPYMDSMSSCDHLKRYGECDYCKHMVKPSL